MKRRHIWFDPIPDESPVVKRFAGRAAQREQDIPSRATITTRRF